MNHASLPQWRYSMGASFIEWIFQVHRMENAIGCRKPSRKMPTIGAGSGEKRILRTCWKRFQGTLNGPGSCTGTIFYSNANEALRPSLAGTSGSFHSVRLHNEPPRHPPAGFRLRAPPRHPRRRTARQDRAAVRRQGEADLSPPDVVHGRNVLGHWVGKAYICI